jgi:hypothetical protein
MPMYSGSGTKYIAILSEPIDSTKLPVFAESKSQAVLRRPRSAQPAEAIHP